MNNLTKHLKLTSEEKEMARLLAITDFWSLARTCMHMNEDEKLSFKDAYKKHLNECKK